MKKLIVLKEEQARLMTVEETMNHFEGMLNKFANKTKNYNNVEGFEDAKQIGYIALIDAFETYDEKHCFSTHLHTKLMHEYSKLHQKTKTDKYKAKENYVNISLDYTLEDGNTLSELYGNECKEILQIQQESNFIEDIFNECDEKNKVILMYLIDGEHGDVNVLAKKLNMSRQGFHKRMKKLKQNIAEKYLSNYCIN